MSDSNSQPNPRPFLPEPEPTTDDAFLTFEFTPCDSTTAIVPSEATGTGTQYRTSDDRIVFQSPSHYDAIELNDNFVRYTVSIPNPTNIPLDTHLVEAKSQLSDSLPYSLGECSLTLYLAGKNSTRQAAESNITPWVEENFETTPTIEDTDIGGLSIITLPNPTPVTIC